MGHGFSGSTLLTLLLGAHPDMATVGETEVVPAAKVDQGSLTCSCQRLFRDCEFWRRVEGGMAARGHHFDVVDAAALDFRAPHDPLADGMMRAGPRGPVLETVRRLGLDLLPGPRRVMAKIVQRNQDFIETVTALNGCRVFVDASKRPVRALHLRRLTGARVKVIHLVRDGRAVACSAMRNLGAAPEAGAVSWLRTNLACERARHQFAADDWMLLRYEDLCADPAAALAALQRFIGVAERPPAGDFHDGQHVIGNRMRLRHAGEIVADERWRQSLGAAERTVIERVLGSLNRGYGYADL